MTGEALTAAQDNSFQPLLDWLGKVAGSGGSTPLPSTRIARAVEGGFDGEAAAFHSGSARGLALGWAGSVPAQAAVAVAVSIEPRAKLVADGAVRGIVVVSCGSDQQVLEAHLSVSQDDQTIFGQAGIPIRCDGKSRKYRVTVSPLEGSFHTGDAFASAFVLTCADSTCATTEQGQDSGTITVR